MKQLRYLLRKIKCYLLIRYYRLSDVHATAYIALGSDICRDLVAGEYSYIGHSAIIGPKVSIGAYSMLGPQVLCIGDDHRYDRPGVPIIFSERPELRPTIIGRDVWIGAGAIIFSGVEIGDGSIVAAGSVVTRSIPPCEIHGGVPNRKLKDRFNTEEGRKLHLQYLIQEPTMGAFPDTRV